MVEAATSEATTRSKLGDSDAPFIVLRNDCGEPIDIVTSHGCLSGAVPVLQTIADAATNTLLNSWGARELFVTFSIPDCVILRSLGLPAAPGVLLDALTCSGLRQLLALVKGVNGSRSLDLLIVAASLGEITNTIPSALPQTTRHLELSARCLGFDWVGVHVWHPDDHDIETLRHLVHLEASRELQHFLAIDDACQPIDRFLGPGPPRRPTTPEIYFELLDKKVGPW